jgi:hypothetical protein
MGESQITVTVQERDYLVRLLEQSLKETRVEEHRTRAPTYREHIIEQENAIQSLLAKLGRPQKQSAASSHTDKSLPVA